MPTEKSDNTAAQADVLLAKATEALRAGEPDEALDLLKEAAAIAPLRPDVRELMAEALDASLSEEPAKPKARRSRRAAKAAPASKEMRRLPRAPGLPAIVKGLSLLAAVLIVCSVVAGVFFFRHQITQRITAWIDHTMVIDPQEQARREFVARAESLLNEGHYDYCISFIAERRDKFPELQGKINSILAEAHYKNAEAYSRRKEYGKAMDHYKEATFINPGQAEFQHAEGWNYFVFARSQGTRSQNYKLFLQRAERSIQQAITLAPENAVYHLDLGQVYVALDRRDKAVESYRKVLDLAEAGSEEASRANKLMKMLME